MAKVDHEPLQVPILDSLHAALIDAQKAEDQANERLQQAKADLAAAKAQVKRYQAALNLLTAQPLNGTSGSLTKDSVRPYVQRLLADGDVTDAEFSERLQAMLRKDGIATSGIALVLRHLKKEFDVDGVWSLSPPAGPLASPSNP